MNLSAYLNDKTLKSKFSDILAKYDPDGNGFTKQEFSYALKNATRPFARHAVSIFSIDKIYFKKIDKDKNKILSYDEIADYIKQEFKLDFNKICNMTFEQINEELKKIKE